jgi:hypothetical protein
MLQIDLQQTYSNESHYTTGNRYWYPQDKMLGGLQSLRTCWVWATQPLTCRYTEICRLPVHDSIKGKIDWPWNTLYGSFSCTSKAAARIRPCLRAAARESSSTRPPRAVFTRNAPASKTHSFTLMDYLLHISSCFFQTCLALFQY